MLFRGFLIDLKFSNGSLPVKKLTDFAGVLVLSHKILEGCNKMGYSRKKQTVGVEEGMEFSTFLLYS